MVNRLSVHPADWKRALRGDPALIKRFYGLNSRFVPGALESYHGL